MEQRGKEGRNETAYCCGPLKPQGSIKMGGGLDIDMTVQAVCSNSTRTPYYGVVVKICGLAGRVLYSARSTVRCIAASIGR